MVLAVLAWGVTTGYISCIFYSSPPCCLAHAGAPTAGDGAINLEEWPRRRVGGTVGDCGVGGVELDAEFGAAGG